MGITVNPVPGIYDVNKEMIPVNESLIVNRNAEFPIYGPYDSVYGGTSYSSKYLESNIQKEYFTLQDEHRKLNMKYSDVKPLKEPLELNPDANHLNKFKGTGKTITGLNVEKSMDQIVLFALGFGIFTLIKKVF